MSMSEHFPEQARPLIAWLKKFDELTLRERVIVSFTVLTLVGLGWLLLVDDYFSMRKAVASRSAQMTELELVNRRARAGELTDLAALNPNDPVKKEIQAAKSELSALEQNLQSSLSQFIPPNAMTLVLKDVMADHKGLTLLQLNRLPARELLPEEEDTNLFLHPMRIELEGSYLQILDYVKSLEQGDWQFNWKSFDYHTEKYPSGIAEIEIETLSKNEHWLGI